MTLHLYGQVKRDTDMAWEHPFALPARVAEEIILSNGLRGGSMYF